MATADRHHVRRAAPVLYLGAVAGLVLVLVTRSTVSGSVWLLVGGLSVQPSELAKLAVVVGWPSWSPAARQPRADAGSARWTCWPCSAWLRCRAR
ncbi:MAG: FtsW/RodA/SpoVE family cell cycle protein [Nocardioides sp.]